MDPEEGPSSAGRFKARTGWEDGDDTATMNDLRNTTTPGPRSRYQGEGIRGRELESRNTMMSSSSALSSVPSDFPSSQLSQDKEQDSTPRAHPVTSSFGSTASSSRRVTRGDGQVIVTASDDDNDNGWDSLSDDGEDILANFISHNGPPTPSKKMPIIGAGGGGSGRSKPLKKASDRVLRSVASSTTRKYKFSLDDLVADAKRDQAQEAKVAEVKTALEDSSGKRTATKKVVLDGEKNDRTQEDLYDLIPEDGEEAYIQRLKDAVTRTEVFLEGKNWSFFQHDLPTKPPYSQMFPDHSIHPASWEAVLLDPASRKRAFLSGIVGEVIHKTSLTDEVLLWIFYSVADEPCDQLRYAYSSTLKVCPTPQISSLIQPYHIDQLFRDFGAKDTAVATSEPLGYNGKGSKPSTLPDYKYLISGLSSLEALANKMSDVTTSHALKILLRLAVDETVMSDCRVCAQTQKTIVALFSELGSAAPSLDVYDLSVELFKTIQVAVFQSTLIKNIPPLTPALALFRCRLAVAFLFQDLTALDQPVEKLNRLKQLTEILAESRLRISADRPGSKESFDYWEFSSLISMIDAVVDAATLATPFSSSKAESEFNKEVDSLADQVKLVFTSIQDSGASHLKRTEAKEALQALCQRLLFAVRTKPQPKKSWFGAENKSASLMENFAFAGKDGVDM